MPDTAEIAAEDTVAQYKRTLGPSQIQMSVQQFVHVTVDTVYKTLPLPTCGPWSTSPDSGSPTRRFLARSTLRLTNSS